VKDFFIRQERDEKIIIGGVVSLADFFADEIIVRVGGGTIAVTGRNLVIERFDENEIMLVGRICGVVTNVR
jgi:hypothetical protein